MARTFEKDGETVEAVNAASAVKLWCLVWKEKTTELKTEELPGGTDDS